MCECMHEQGSLLGACVLQVSPLALCGIPLVYGTQAPSHPVDVCRHMSRIPFSHSS